jgi:hypothetical protein
MNLFFKKLDFNYIKWHKNQLGVPKGPPWFLEYSEDCGIRRVKQSVATHTTCLNIKTSTVTHKEHTYCVIWTINIENFPKYHQAVGLCRAHSLVAVWSIFKYQKPQRIPSALGKLHHSTRTFIPKITKSTWM